MRKNPRSPFIGHWSWAIVHCSMIALILLTVVLASQAQGTGPLVIIQGTPDTTTAPPEVRTYVSVIDKSTAQTINDLASKNFQIEEAGGDIGTPAIFYEPVGLAIVVVVDRGGISAPRDPRIKEATDLVRELVNRLSVTGAADDDVIGIVGVGEDGALQPEEDFSYNPVDTNLVLNALVTMEGETVRGGTPLYEGLDEALRLLTAHTDATIRDVLSHRRKVIVVFSDGVDPDFSDTAREEDIIRKANNADISLYTVGMAQRNRDLSAGENLKRLAHQTYGLYQLHNNDGTHQQVLDLFGHLMTQRQQYLVTYSTRLPKGDYTLNIGVDTPIGSAESSVTISSILEKPRLRLTSSTEGQPVTVPISHTETSCLLLSTQRTDFRYLSTPVHLSAEVVLVDDAPRDPAEVRYFANGAFIGASTTPPTYDFTWDVSTVVTPTEETRVQEFTLTGEADDAYLGERMETQAVTIEVTWEPTEQTGCAHLVEWLGTYWWLLVVLAALAVGLLVLLILLIRTRGELARKVVARTTGVLKGVTKHLGAMPQRAPGKLVILQGANMGKEFRLATQVVKVGRDPQFCDFALYDEYTSNPHFSIQLEQTQFFITDEGSTNSTRVNGMPIQPRQRVLLQPDAIIEVGQTRLQFKRLGGTTRQLGGRPAPPSGPAQGGAPPTQLASPPGPAQQTPPPTELASPRGPAQQTPPPTQLASPPGPAQQTPPPTELASPRGPAQGPQQPGPGQRGGPTRQVPS